jgi:hypothetical protein
MMARTKEADGARIGRCSCAALHEEHETRREGDIAVLLRSKTCERQREVGFTP